MFPWNDIRWYEAMGKGISKWIRNLLMGKRDDNEKEMEKETGPPPNIKRRWSFRRSTSTRPITTTHKSTKSFDSILMPKQSLFEYHTQNAHSAATKIQAFYRSYLARRALRALRGLVKLQALARGYLVRKQINSVVRSMHAVMAIQVRARIQRLQTPHQTLGTTISNPQLLIKDISERNKVVRNSFPTSVRSTSGGGIDNVYGERVVCNYGRVSVEYQLKMCPTSSTDSSSITDDGQVEELSSKTAQKIYSVNKHPFISRGYIPSDDTHFAPSYLSNTKSSKAKTRSHSEPRRRPKLGPKQKSSSSSRRSSSMDGKNENENKYPWLNRCDKSANYQGDCDYNISGTKSMIPFEPPMNLY